MIDPQIVPILRMFNGWITEHKTVIDNIANLEGHTTEDFLKLMLDDALDAWGYKLLCEKAA